MYKTCEELLKAYGFDNPELTRDMLDYATERAFVSDCYDTYEHIGFTATFGTPYTGERIHVGKKFKVLSRVKEISEDAENGADLECLPMWNIELEDGTRMAAYPEEICVAERKNYGTVRKRADAVAVEKKLEVSMGDKKLVAYVNDWHDELPKEIYIVVEDESGVELQTVCMAREHYYYDAKSRDQIVDSSRVDCRVWNDDSVEDHTHEFTIPVYNAF